MQYVLCYLKNIYIILNSYSQIPAVLGCKDWITEKVHTIGEIEKALDKIDAESKAAYIEICIDRDDVPPSYKPI